MSRAVDAAAAPPPSDANESLTARELEVAELVACGMTNREIADALVVSARTIQAHVGALMRKTSTDNRTHLSVTLIRAGVIRL